MTGFDSTKTEVSIELLCPRCDEGIEKQIESRFLGWVNRYEGFIDGYGVQREMISFDEVLKVSLSFLAVGDCSGLISEFLSFAEEKRIEIRVVHEQCYKFFEEEEELPF